MSDVDFVEFCGKSSAAQVQAAIKAGANVNAKNDEGLTPLHKAVLPRPRFDRQ